MKILLVEDNLASAQLLVRVLTYSKHEVVHSMYGLEGIQLARQIAFDLILMDFNLPDINGSQVGLVLCKELKHTTIFALTADNDRITRKKAQSFGFDDFITKPIDIPEFLKKIEALAAQYPS